MNYSNASGKEEAISQGVSALSNVFETAIKGIPEIKKRLKVRCGRKPIFNGKGQKDTYNSCVNNFYYEIKNDKSLNRELEMIQIQSEIDAKKSKSKSIESSMQLKNKRYMALGISSLLIVALVVIIVKKSN